MLEPLRMIPGSIFLLTIVGLTGVGIYLHFFRAWGPRRVEPVVEMRLTPYELAYLARGSRGVIETALATAHADGLLHVNPEAKLATALANARPNEPVLAELLKELTELGGSLRGLKLSGSIDAIRRDLVEAGLLDRSTRGQIALRGLLIFGSIQGIAISKLYLGLLHDRPSVWLGFMVFLLFPVLFISLFAKSRRGSPTPAGRRCVADRRQAMGPLLHDPESVSRRPDARPMLTSVFGFRELSTSPWAGIIPLAGIAIATSPLWMNPPAASSAFSSSSGGFDGGWSSNSSDSGCGGGSSDGGSSDSGGGGGGDSGCGGGGGCGGCGGGGGD